MIYAILMFNLREWRDELMLKIRENQLDVNTYLQLRASVDWKVLSEEQAKRALDNSLFTVCIYDDDIPVGMGRIVGDGVVIDYIQDLVIRPEYQSKGIGSKVINRLIKYVKDSKIDDTEIMLCLMCAKGREDFYRHFDFIARPNEKLGPGMIQYL